MDILRVEDSYFPRKQQFNCKGKLFTISKPMVMGIVNCTPDSFYEKSRISSLEALQEKLSNFAKHGADIVDIGGYSSRPDATDISVDEELKRILHAIGYAKKHFPKLLVSVDTFRAEVARIAVEHGADIVNDISGGTLDLEMFKTISKLNCPYIMMHMRGTPQTMKNLTSYENITVDLLKFFSDQLQKATKAGVKDVIIDPGFGFAKNTEQNFELLRKLELFHVLERPLLVGFSRKSMIYKTLGISPEESLAATTAVNLLALQKGALILRVHDVKEAREAVKLHSYLSV